MKKLLKFLFLVGIILGYSRHLAFSQDNASIVGTYRCWKMNVGGAGGRCPTGAPPLVLNSDGTYHLSSERGTYSVEGSTVVLSASKIRGPGHIEGNQIYFEYEYRGLSQSITYLRQSGGEDSSSKTPSRIVSVELMIHFGHDDGTLSWINTGSLYPVGGSKMKRWDGIARQSDSLTIRVGFRDVPAGRLYRLFLSTGREQREVGTLDLRKAKGPVELELNVP